MNIKLIIIDDELDAIESIELLIKNFIDNVEIIGRAQSALEGLKLINKLKPDIVLLDIEMPGGNGFDLIEAIPSKEFAVIFTTASSEYSIKALRVKAVDYLLKPIIVEELEEAIHRAIAELHKNTLIYDKIPLPDLTGYTYVNILDIIHLKGDGNYTTVYFGNTNKVVSKNIKYFVDLLPADIFYRCHQSHLVNINEIKELKKNEGTYLIMSNGNKVDVSRANNDIHKILFSK